MNIELVDVAFETDDPRFPDMERIVLSIVDGWHEWSGPDPTSAQLQSYTDSHSNHAELLLKSYMHSVAYGSKTAKKVLLVEASPLNPTFHDTGAVKMGLASAARFLTKSLEVIVENARNDGDFFSRYLAVVDPELIEMLQKENPPFRFSNGGGKNEIRRFVPRRAAWHAERNMPPRMTVLVDSDRKFPSHKVGETTKVMNVCTTAGVTCFVLDKRAIENYLSDAFLRQYASVHPGVTETVEFLIGLSPHQRDFFHVKEGVVPPAAGEQHDLYAGIELTRLRSKLPRAMEYFFENPDLSPTIADMKARGCYDEMVDLAHFIRSEL